ncbi:CMGC/CDK/CDK9 protein kinase Cdk9 [Schizosaccharomyces japonicus yFS275]|uniref:CMGC/CDK/CDK9 protein kinase Cdk9 n=1 Tax=Schizosaccharomyces japonicus (strain yFS275 / FY16936) TaxID=402676 RepID=B6K378_SCHJY|nr:CMGC/CDK/CDK9 protein kinase Cdk9 [Schizosaccharomyces japonicus yFS275]EEB07935.1 CMGC/CDK/CDK9 protein kinase Cdk9 [Schizosaccharomyces japonicus yFS275]
MTDDKEMSNENSKDATTSTTLQFTGCSPLSDYEILDKLGEGTFGEVYKARRHKDAQLYALKKILMHNEREGFPITALREIKIIKNLNHRNVINISDMAIVPGNRKHRKRGSIYMVTPYMDHDLSGLLENPSVQFSEAQIKCYTKQLLEGTKYLHDSHILHRDLKAANLLIDNKGVLKIADFGLARVFTEDSYTGSPNANPAKRREYTNCVVTRWYRAPELLLGERRYTTSIDVWSIGCILAEMYKGKPILPGTSDLDQLDRIFRLCGTATQATMPNWEKLPGCEGVRSFYMHPRTLESAFHSYGPQMVSLTSQLLKLDQEARISAAEALKHPYFYTEPYPARPDELVAYASSHEYDRRKNRTAAQDAANRPQKPFRFATRGPKDPYIVRDRSHDHHRRSFDGERKRKFGYDSDRRGGPRNYYNSSRDYNDSNRPNAQDNQHMDVDGDGKLETAGPDRGPASYSSSQNNGPHGRESRFRDREYMNPRPRRYGDYGSRENAYNPTHSTSEIEYVDSYIPSYSRASRSNVSQAPNASAHP